MARIPEEWLRQYIKLLGRERDMVEGWFFEIGEYNVKDLHGKGRNRLHLLPWFEDFNKKEVQVIVKEKQLYGADVYAKTFMD